MYFFLWLKKVLFFSTYLLLLICGIYACASVGSPGGGDYDIEPPRFQGSDPAPNTVNYSGKKVTLWFDEYIAIENAAEKVIVTPPQLNMPVIRVIGRRIEVELRDSLIPNTTYTFDFTDAIADNNEKNVLDGFTFAFSTGEVIDTLVISGCVLNAKDLEPMPKIVVGIHSDLSDSAFSTRPFSRISQTNDRGHFSIRNIAPGTYRVYALNDLNRDFKYDQPGEAIAFHDSLVIPSFEQAMRIDTLWKDSLTIDTIRYVSYTRFTPDNLLMKLFEEKVDIQYLSKSERINPRQWTMEFNSDISMPPQITLLNAADGIQNDWYILQQSPDQKKMTYWITDSLAYQQDTLWIKADYMKSDTLNNLIATSDTIKLYQRGRNRQQEKEGANQEKIEFLDATLSPSGLVNIFDTIKIQFSEPLAAFDREKIILEQKVDTLWERRDYPIVQDSLNPLMYYIDYPWPYKQDYRVQIDSATIFSIYGKWNNAKTNIFRTKSEEDYGSLYVQISGINLDGFGELVNAGGNVVKASWVIDGELLFQDIQPGKYYLRYIDDRNKNGRWDTGDYGRKTQPEDVYYYPGAFEIKKYVEWEQSWNITALPFDRQKPLEITKNKPVEKKTQEEKRNESRRNANARNNTPGRLR